MLESMPEPLFTAKQVADQTNRDPILSRVLHWTWHGWPDSKEIPQEFKPFLTRRNEISAYKNCLLVGNKVIIPPGGREEVLDLLHSGHLGIVRMKALARSYVWWPGLDQAIEERVGKCHACQESRHMPPKAPVFPWEWAKAPWTRLHIDFAGPFQGHIFLIVVCSYSKWLEVRKVPSTSTEATVRVLRELFATHGIPEVVVSDNHTAFTSEEFRVFVDRNEIRHTHIASYHPSSNGQVERH